MNPEVTYIVSNRSSRDGVAPRLIVLHTTEGTNRRGISDLSSLGSYFDQPSVEASSHVANDAEGHDARFVPDGEKAWTCSNDNPFTLNLEQIAFASTGRREWFEDHPKQLANTACWIAYWNREHDIPIRRGIAPAGVLIRSGVASHKQLGLMGGGHWDPGPSYPMRYVLLLARLMNARDAKAKQKLRRKLNRIRKHYGLPALGPKASR
jgi:N-acetylmuramoyl-L-alanine amidase